MSAFYGLSVLITNDVADEWPWGEAAAAGNWWEYNGSLFPESIAAMERYAGLKMMMMMMMIVALITVFIHSNSYMEAPVKNSSNTNVSITCWPFVTVLTELF